MGKRHVMDEIEDDEEADDEEEEDENQVGVQVIQARLARVRIDVMIKPPGVRTNETNGVKF